MQESAAKAHRIVFAVTAGSKSSGIRALMLARSLRTFGGQLASSPFWVLAPRASNPLPTALLDGFAAAHIRLILFDIDEAVYKFLFGAKTCASAVAEAEAREITSLLAWVDPDMLIIQEPGELLIEEDKDLGYRPVHHINIGSPYDEPADDFWRLIYDHCEVPEEAIFPMTTCADQLVIRPYFNAGCLIVRPENGLLNRWRANFLRLYQEPFFESFYELDVLYRVFIHQAILSGTILSFMNQSQMHEFSDRINYPLNLHDEYHEDRRARTLNELITCRYDVGFHDPSWREGILIEEPFKSWLDEQLKFEV